MLLAITSFCDPGPCVPAGDLPLCGQAAPVGGAWGDTSEGGKVFITTSNKVRPTHSAGIIMGCVVGYFSRRCERLRCDLRPLASLLTSCGGVFVGLQALLARENRPTVPTYKHDPTGA